MTDERLKIWIDLGKWAVVSVGLVIMTKIIDTGFRDREVGINEIKEYDKYVSLVTDNSKISERRLLAQYFAHVTPSDKLKEGWTAYFETVDQEYQALMEAKERKQNELAEIVQSSDSANLPMAKIQQLEQEIQTMNDELTPTFKKRVETNNYEQALNWERIGFENLLDRNLDQAIQAFENSENSYATFHQVYEIARFLRNRKNSGERQNDTFWLDIYQKVVDNYSWKMPEDIKTQLEEQAN